MNYGANRPDDCFGPVDAFPHRLCVRHIRLQIDHPVAVRLQTSDLLPLIRRQGGASDEDKAESGTLPGEVVGKQ